MNKNIIVTTRGSAPAIRSILGELLSLLLREFSRVLIVVQLGSLSLAFGAEDIMIESDSSLFSILSVHEVQCCFDARDSYDSFISFTSFLR